MFEIDNAFERLKQLLIIRFATPNEINIDYNHGETIENNFWKCK